MGKDCSAELKSRKRAQTGAKFAGRVRQDGVIVKAAELLVIQLPEVEKDVDGNE